MKLIEKDIRNAEGGFGIAGAKKLVKAINEAFTAGALSFVDYLALKNALIDNLAEPEHDRIKIANSFKY
jgi:hypothetical protein